MQAAHRHASAPLNVHGALLLAITVLSTRPAASEPSTLPYRPSPSFPEERFASPPGHAYENRDGEGTFADRAAASSIRFHVGPALSVEPVSPGLFAAVDIGKSAVGVRFSGAWLGAKSREGLESYGSELWIDFGHSARLHPIVGAGAAWLRESGVKGDGSALACVIRGGLEYRLPLAGANAEPDARLGVNVLALVPAIGTDRERPWILGAVSVGIGF
jgi:hypothetical protein